MYNFIIQPHTLQKININSKKGTKLLKKYLKQYLKLQKGGNQPQNFILPYVSHFIQNETEFSNLLKEYSDPAIGCIWNNTKAVFNHFFIDLPGPLMNKTTLLHRYFYTYTGEIKIINKIANIGDYEIFCNLLGQIIGYLFKLFIHKNEDGKSKFELFYEKVEIYIENIKHLSMNIQNSKNKEDRNNNIQKFKDYKINSINNFKTLFIDEFNIFMDIFETNIKNVFHKLFVNKKYLKKNAFLSREKTDFFYLLFNQYENFGENVFIKKICHILLSVLWNKSSDISGIISYYKGMRNILGDLSDQYLLDLSSIENVVPLELSLVDIESIREESLSEANYNKKLMIEIIDKKGNITIQDTKQFHFSDIFHEPFSKLDKYPDCGSTSLRNFMKLLCFDKNIQTDSESVHVEGHFELLEELGAADFVKQYFKIFYKDSFFVNDNIKFDCPITEWRPDLRGIVKDGYHKLNSVQAWDILLMNLPNTNFGEIRYSHKMRYLMRTDEHSGKELRYEIYDSNKDIELNHKNTIFNILLILFNKHEEIDTPEKMDLFLKDIFSKFYTIGEDIDIKNIIKKTDDGQITVNLNFYNWVLSGRHYSFERIIFSHNFNNLDANTHKKELFMNKKYLQRQHIILSINPKNMKNDFDKSIDIKKINFMNHKFDNILFHDLSITDQQGIYIKNLLNLLCEQNTPIVFNFMSRYLPQIEDNIDHSILQKKLILEIFRFYHIKELKDDSLSYFFIDEFRNFIQKVFKNVLQLLLKKEDIEIKSGETDGISHTNLCINTYSFKNNLFSKNEYVPLIDLNSSDDKLSLFVKLCLFEQIDNPIVSPFLETFLQNNTLSIDENFDETFLIFDFCQTTKNCIFNLENQKDKMLSILGKLTNITKVNFESKNTKLLFAFRNNIESIEFGPLFNESLIFLFNRFPKLKNIHFRIEKERAIHKKLQEIHGEMKFSPQLIPLQEKGIKITFNETNFDISHIERYFDYEYDYNRQKELEDLQIIQSDSIPYDKELSFLINPINPIKNI